MPQQIQVPGHGLVEFPDGMTDEQIVSAIKANPAPANSTDMSQTAQDISYGQQRVNAIKTGLQNMVSPDFWKSVGHDLTNFPPLPINPQTGKTDFSKLLNDPALMQNSMNMVLSTMPITPMSSASRVAIANPSMAGVPKTNLTPSQFQIAQDATKMGAKLTPGQATGSPGLQRLEASIESFPPTSGTLSKVKSTNQSLLNNTVAESIGQKGTSVDSAVLDKAQRDFATGFQKFGDSTPVTLDVPNMQKGLDSISSSAEGLTQTPIANNPLFKMAQNQVANGTATRQELQNLSSKLGKRATAEFRSVNGDRELGVHLSDLKEMVDDSLMGSLSPADQAAFQTLRGQYRNFVNVLSNGGVINESTGNVSGKVLANTLAKRDPSGYTLGRNTSPMYTMAHFNEAFPAAVGDSGTASRSFLPWLLSSIGGGTGIGSMFGHPIGGAVTGLTLPLLAKGAAEGYAKIPATALLNRAIPSTATSMFPIQRGLLAADAQYNNGLLGQ